VDPTAADRPVVSVTTAPSGFEGEGFPVRRAFAGVDLRALDPFVHMDQMGEVDYAPGEPKGTPWHPHRGFETVTYVIDGIFRHQNSNGGLITDGDTQWMTAGAGLSFWQHKSHRRSDVQGAAARNVASTASQAMPGGRATRVTSATLSQRSSCSRT
jgi:redox-sensitive bicupin YhaK (pirin superfamily)